MPLVPGDKLGSYEILGLINACAWEKVCMAPIRGSVEGRDQGLASKSSEIAPDEAINNTIRRHQSH